MSVASQPKHRHSVRFAASEGQHSPNHNNRRQKVISISELSASNIAATTAATHADDQLCIYAVITLGGRRYVTPFAGVPPSVSLPNSNKANDAHHNNNNTTDSSHVKHPTHGGIRPLVWHLAEADPMIFYWEASTSAMPDAEFNVYGRHRRIVEEDRMRTLAKTAAIVKLLESSSSSDDDDDDEDKEEDDGKHKNHHSADHHNHYLQQREQHQPVDPMSSDVFLGYARVRLDEAMLHRPATVRLGIRDHTEDGLLRQYGTLGSLTFQLAQENADAMTPLARHKSGSKMGDSGSSSGGDEYASFAAYMTHEKAAVARVLSSAKSKNKKHGRDGGLVDGNTSATSRQSSASRQQAEQQQKYTFCTITAATFYPLDPIFSAAAAAQYRETLHAREIRRAQRQMDRLAALEKLDSASQEEWFRRMVIQKKAADRNNASPKIRAGSSGDGWAEAAVDVGRLVRGGGVLGQVLTTDNAFVSLRLQSSHEMPSSAAAGSSNSGHHKMDPSSGHDGVASSTTVKEWQTPIVRCPHSYGADPNEKSSFHHQQSAKQKYLAALLGAEGGVGIGVPPDGTDEMREAAESRSAAFVWDSLHVRVEAEDLLTLSATMNIALLPPEAYDAMASNVVGGAGATAERIKSYPSMPLATCYGPVRRIERREDGYLQATLPCYLPSSTTTASPLPPPLNSTSVDYHGDSQYASETDMMMYSGKSALSQSALSLSRSQNNNTMDSINNNDGSSSLPPPPPQRRGTDMKDTNNDSVDMLLATRRDAPPSTLHPPPPQQPQSRIQSVPQQQQQQLQPCGWVSLTLLPAAHFDLNAYTRLSLQQQQSRRRSTTPAAARNVIGVPPSLPMSKQQDEGQLPLALPNSNTNHLANNNNIMNGDATVPFRGRLLSAARGTGTTAEGELLSASPGGLVVRPMSLTLKADELSKTNSGDGSGAAFVVIGVRSLAGEGRPGVEQEVFSSKPALSHAKSDDPTMRIIEWKDCVFVAESIGQASGLLYLDVYEVAYGGGSNNSNNNSSTTPNRGKKIGRCTWSYSQLPYVGETMLPLPPTASGQMQMQWNISPEVQQAVLLQEIAAAAAATTTNASQADGMLGPNGPIVALLPVAGGDVTPNLEESTMPPTTAWKSSEEKNKKDQTIVRNQAQQQQQQMGDILSLENSDTRVSYAINRTSNNNHTDVVSSIVPPPSATSSSATPLTLRLTIHSLMNARLPASATTAPSSINIMPYVVVRYGNERRDNYSADLPSITVHKLLESGSSNNNRRRLSAQSAASPPVVTWNDTVRFDIPAMPPPHTTTSSMPPATIEVWDGITRQLFGVCTVPIAHPGHQETVTTRVLPVYRSPHATMVGGPSSAESDAAAQVADLTLLTCIGPARSLLSECFGIESPPGGVSGAVTLYMNVLGAHNIAASPAAVRGGGGNNIDDYDYNAVNPYAVVSIETLPPPDAASNSVNNSSPSGVMHRTHRQYRSVTIQHSASPKFFMELPPLTCYSPDDVYRIAIYHADAEGFDEMLGEAQLTAGDLLLSQQQQSSANHHHHDEGVLATLPQVLQLPLTLPSDNNIHDGRRGSVMIEWSAAACASPEEVMQVTAKSGGSAPHMLEVCVNSAMSCALPDGIDASCAQLMVTMRTASDTTHQTYYRASDEDAAAGSRPMLLPPGNGNTTTTPSMMSVAMTTGKTARSMTGETHGRTSPTAITRDSDSGQMGCQFRDAVVALRLASRVEPVYITVWAVVDADDDKKGLYTHNSSGGNGGPVMLPLGEAMLLPSAFMCDSGSSQQQQQQRHQLHEVSLRLQPRRDPRYRARDVKRANQNGSGSTTGLGTLSVRVGLFSVSGYDVRLRHHVRAQGLTYTLQLQLVDTTDILLDGRYMAEVRCLGTGESYKSSRPVSGYNPKFNESFSLEMHKATEVVEVRILRYQQQQQQKAEGSAAHGGELFGVATLTIVGPGEDRTSSSSSSSATSEVLTAWLTIATSSRGTAASAGPPPPSSSQHDGMEMDEGSCLPRLLVRWRTIDQKHMRPGSNNSHHHRNSISSNSEQPPRRLLGPRAASLDALAPKPLAASSLSNPPPQTAATNTLFAPTPPQLPPTHPSSTPARVSLLRSSPAPSLDRSPSQLNTPKKQMEGSTVMEPFVLSVLYGPTGQLMTFVGTPQSSSRDVVHYCLHVQHADHLLPAATATAAEGEEGAPLGWGLYSRDNRRLPDSHALSRYLRNGDYVQMLWSEEIQSLNNEEKQNGGANPSTPRRVISSDYSLHPEHLRESNERVLDDLARRAMREMASLSTAPTPKASALFSDTTTLATSTTTCLLTLCGTNVFGASAQSVMQCALQHGVNGFGYPTRISLSTNNNKDNADAVIFFLQATAAKLYAMLRSAMDSDGSLLFPAVVRPRDGGGQGGRSPALILLLEIVKGYVPVLRSGSFRMTASMEEMRTCLENGVRRTSAGTTVCYNSDAPTTTPNNNNSGANDQKRFQWLYGDDGECYVDGRFL